MEAQSPNHWTTREVPPVLSSLGPIPLLYDFILIYIFITSAETLLPNKVTFTGTGGLGLGCIFLEDTIQPTIAPACMLGHITDFFLLNRVMEFCFPSGTHGLPT